MTFGAEPVDGGGVDVPRRPEHHGIEDQAERAELVLHPVPARLVDGAALAVAHVAGRLVAGFLHSELPVHLAAVGVIDRVDDTQLVLSPGAAPVLGERLSQRDRAILTPEHPQQVVGAHLVGDQRSGRPQCPASA